MTLNCVAVNLPVQMLYLWEGQIIRAAFSGKEFNKAYGKYAVNRMCHRHSYEMFDILTFGDGLSLEPFTRTGWRNEVALSGTGLFQLLLRTAMQRRERRWVLPNDFKLFFEPYSPGMHAAIDWSEHVLPALLSDTTPDNHFRRIVDREREMRGHVWAAFAEITNWKQ